MNFLAAVVPGVRELRTPLVVGGLWALVVALIEAPNWDSTLKANHGVAQLQRTITDLPVVYRGAALAVGIYLLGCVALEVQKAVGQFLRAVARFLVEWVPADDWPYRILGRRNWAKRSVYAARDALSQTPTAVRAAVLDAAANAFARSGAPGGAFLATPVDEVADQMPAAARQMWESAPQQAQEYDRLSAEGEFRAAVVPTVSAVAAVCALNVSAWIWLAIPASLTLLYQGYASRRAAYEVLIAAMHLGYVRVPVLENLTQELTGMGLPDDQPTWMAASVIAAHRLGEFELAHGYLLEAPQMLAIGSVDDAVNLASFERFLDEHNTEYAELFRRRQSGYYDRPIEERLREP